jgi:2-haloacid dehalogenase
MNVTLAFDVYGTLVDPNAMAEHVARDVGLKAADFAEYWRGKQLEYSFRRGLMKHYADFSVCTSDALNFTCRRIQRSEATIYDPWGIEPNVTVRSLVELPSALGASQCFSKIGPA